MDDLTIIKGLAISLGATISTIITFMFALPFPAFVAGFIGAFIGEMALATPTSFKKSATIIIVTSVAAAYVGSLFVKYAHEYPPTGILAVVGFAITYGRDTILDGINSILKAAIEKVKNFLNPNKSE